MHSRMMQCGQPLTCSVYFNGELEKSKQWWKTSRVLPMWKFYIDYLIRTTDCGPYTYLSTPRSASQQSDPQKKRIRYAILVVFRNQAKQVLLISYWGQKTYNSNPGSNHIEPGAGSTTESDTCTLLQNRPAFKYSRGICNSTHRIAEFQDII